MNLNHIVIWMAGLSAVMLLFTSRRLPADSSRGWRIKCVALLASIFLLGWLAPSYAGVGVGLLWAVLIVLPSLGQRQVMRLSLLQRYETAHRLTRLLALLHPADGWLEQPRLFQALVLEQRGRIDEAERLLEPYAGEASSSSRAARLHLFRLQGRWEELVRWIEALPASMLRAQAGQVMWYLRALGEAGDLNGLAREFDRRRDVFAAPPLAIIRQTCRLCLFAFCGEAALVERLLNTAPLSSGPPNLKALWRATAAQACGDPEAGPMLERLLASDDGLERRTAERRLAHPTPLAAAVLTAESREILDRSALELEQEERYVRPGSLEGRRSVVTWSLVGANLAMFGLELASGGATHGPTLFRLGALYAPAVVEGGEWWRLVGALFLHAGSIHLVMNLVALLMLGRFVELSLGRWRYLFTYLVAGVGSMAGLVILSSLGQLPPQLTVGASGGIMGLVGATASILWRGWRRERAGIAWARLRWIALIIAMQVVFDLTTPQISFSGHTLGLVLGAVAALAVQGRRGV